MNITKSVPFQNYAHPGSCEQRITPAANKTAALGERLISGNLARELPYNFFRDATWTPVSALFINTAGRSVPALDPSLPISTQLASSSFLQTTGAQWLFGTVPMILIAGGEIAYRKAKGEEVQYKKIVPPLIAASLAIPMWDAGQVIGTHIGTAQNSALWHGSSIAAGMIAAPFTGMLEGFAQWGVKYAFDLATNPTLKAKWTSNPSLMRKLLLKEFLLNITIGAIPGAIWQITYFFVLPALLAAIGPVGWSILCAGIIVGVAVMLCNLACTHAINKAGACIDQAMGWDIRLKNLEEELLEKRQSAQISTTSEPKFLKKTPPGWIAA